MRKKNEMLMQFPAVRDQFGSSVRFNLLIGAGTQLSQNIRKLFSRWILSVKHTRSVSAERVKFQSKYEKKNERCKKKQLLCCWKSHRHLIRVVCVIAHGMTSLAKN